eukprot:m.508243 g.508243  ORF g.508243 m.508243 type:complete len:184 (+) comp21881_c0_seq40:2950-3501(+)
MSILNANTKNTTTAVQAAIVQSRGLRERDARGGGERESRFGDGDREPRRGDRDPRERSLPALGLRRRRRSSSGDLDRERDRERERRPPPESPSRRTRTYADSSMCERNFVSSRFLMARSTSSAEPNSTIPSPLFTSVRSTFPNPPSRQKSFKSCHEPLLGIPETITRCSPPPPMPPRPDTFRS